MTHNFNTAAAEAVANAAEQRLQAGFALANGNSWAKRKSFTQLVSSVFRIVGQAHQAGIVDAPREIPGWTTDHKVIKERRQELLESGLEAMVRTVRDAARDKLAGAQATGSSDPALRH